MRAQRTFWQLERIDHLSDHRINGPRDYMTTWRAYNWEQYYSYKWFILSIIIYINFIIMKKKNKKWYPHTSGAEGSLSFFYIYNYFRSNFWVCVCYKALLSCFKINYAIKPRVTSRKRTCYSTFKRFWAINKVTYSKTSI